MTQTSYFHDGATKGDATNAPYSAQLFNSILDIATSSQTAWIMPLYTGNQDVSFDVQADIGRSVTVDNGTAYIAGAEYILTGGPTVVAFAENTSPYPRIDRVAVRVNFSTKTAQLVAIDGVPAEFPVPPTLHQIPGVVFELPLARVYCASGYANTTNNITDERVFGATPDHTFRYRTQNVLANSEMMALNSDYSPAGWSLIGSPTFAKANKFDIMPRGQTVKITATAASQGMSVPFVLRNTIVTSYTPFFTARTLIQVESGTWAVSIHDGVADRRYTTVYSSNEPREIIHRYVAASATPRWTLRIQSLDVSGGVCYVGHTTVSFGNIPAPVGETHEVILLDKPTQIELPALTTYSTSVQTGYTAKIPKGAKAALVTLGGYDTGSAAASTQAVYQTSVSPYANQVKLDIARVANSTTREATGIVTLEASADANYNYQFRLNITASGAGTFNLTKNNIIGVIT